MTWEAAGKQIELLELPPWRALVSRYLGFMSVVNVESRT